MITQMNHVSFTVSNLERSIEFYQKALGLELKGRMTRGSDFASKVTGIPDASLKLAFIAGPNCLLELIEYVTPKAVKADTRTCNVGSAHVCFNVDNFEATVKKALAGGATQAGELTLIPDGKSAGKAMIYLEDPDSNTIEFISNQPLQATE